MAFDSYIFDKRKVKKAMTKFIIACAVSFPILLVLNILTSEFDFWLSVSIALATPKQKPAVLATIISISLLLKR